MRTFDRARGDTPRVASVRAIQMVGRAVAAALVLAVLFGAALVLNQAFHAAEAVNCAGASQTPDRWDECGVSFNKRTGVTYRGGGS